MGWEKHLGIQPESTAEEVEAKLEKAVDYAQVVDVVHLSPDEALAIMAGKIVVCEVKEEYLVILAPADDKS